MKSKKYTQTLFIVTCLIVFSCEQDIPTNLSFEEYQFGEIDENGGNWKPVLIENGSDIVVESPSDVSSDVYQQELTKLKEAIANKTSAEQNTVNYWTNNPLIRWNEITLELIAKYNLIPGPNEDGTYTLPNANNPEGPPSYPFAHPPYASRTLAYLSVAQFDGLISAWHYKYTFNRAAPSQNDKSIISAYPENNIPSYPSDGAVIARVSKKILSAMFPLEVAYLQKLEDEHLQSLIISGSNVESDISAGITIGDKISEIALVKAASDGMKKAQTNKVVSDSIKAAAFERFGWQWENLEIPERPVGLTPLFGKVKPWNIENIASLRPVAPPRFDSEAFLDDVAILKYHANNMTAEKRRISNFWQDGTGTYTPPGHWNRFANEFIVEYHMNPLRSARTMAYLNMALMDAGISCWDAKYYYHYPRPIQMIKGFKTIAGTPNFPSYTSGHSVFSAAGAEVLAYIFPEKASTVRSWAEEAAISRVYGGLHWTFDATVGTEQGRKAAQFTIDRAKLDGAN